MADSDKLCVVCNASCAGMPRIRNEKGQYAHKDCVKAMQAELAVQKDGALATTTESDEEFSDAFDGGMDDLLGDIEVQEFDSASGCPGCGMRMDDGAVVCMGCGHNRASGHQIKTKSSSAGSRGDEVADGRGSAFIESALNQLVYPILGGCIGGAIGLGIWVGIVSVGQIRLGMMAWGLGVLIGIGVSIGSRHSAGAVYGMIAGVIAFGASVGGAYVTGSVLADYYAEKLEPHEVSLDLILGEVVVWDVIDEWVMRGDEVPWPKKWKSWELADWPEDFFSVIRLETEERWNSMDRDEQYGVREDLAAVTPAHSQLIAHDLLEVSFLEFMMHPLNIIFTLLATGTAFVLAARG